MPKFTPPARGSRAWVAVESRRYREFVRKQEGCMPPAIAGVILGVSRQRVHQLMDEGKLEFGVFFERQFIGGNELARFRKLDRDEPGFRYAEILA